MKKINKLDVIYNSRKVGTLALYKERLAAFEYDKDWLADGFSISPLSLPLDQKVFIPKSEPFDGIFGVFADSLPDGWGRLLVDRLMLKNNINPHEAGNLNRLAIVGSSGMGALSYKPAYDFLPENTLSDLDSIAEQCKKLLSSSDSYENIDSLFRLGGSSGGARPKILIKIDGEDWIIKFPSSYDSPDIGKQEYDYSLCAKQRGIEMPESRLFTSKNCAGYFGVKRFDRAIDKHGNVRRIHMISASGLLETSHRIPNLDYEILMKLTSILTKDYAESEKLYRLMCFNVFAHNRDDHSKNFSYLYDEASKCWKLSPAYDLTYSYSIGGEHATTVHGNGSDPRLSDILEVAKAAGIDHNKATKTAADIQECVHTQLKHYL